MEQRNIRRLHIGGAARVEGWEIFDANAGPHVDHQGEACDLSRFPDDTFAELYASHVLEHFDFADEVLPVLAEWRRVLRPGGTLYVSVPDMERLCQLYLRARGLPDKRKMIMCMFFGGHVDCYDYHLTGFDEDYLKRFLEEAGFHSIRRVENFDLFFDSSRIELLDTPISINLIARK